jgi:tetrahydromethanopterin S-methyltransferase subunit C
MQKRNVILWAIAGTAAVGLILAVVLSADAWERVSSFYTGTLVPLALGVEAMVAGNIALEKYREGKRGR